MKSLYMNENNERIDAKKNDSLFCSNRIFPSIKHDLMKNITARLISVNGCLYDIDFFSIFHGAILLPHREQI